MQFKYFSLKGISAIIVLAFIFAQCSKSPDPAAPANPNPGNGNNPPPTNPPTPPPPNPGNGNDSAINIFIPANSFSFYYGYGTLPYRLESAGFVETALRLDSSLAGGLMIEIHNLHANNATSFEIANFKFVRVGNVSSANTLALFNNVTDTAGKVYLRIYKPNGNMTIPGQTHPVASIIEPLVAISPNAVGDGCLVAVDPPFGLTVAITVFTTTSHVNNPLRQIYKLIN